MTQTLLKIDKISKTYPLRGRPPKEALRNICLDLKVGEVFGLLGVNGAGKTTLASILATLHPPTGGDVLWKGQSIYANLLDYRRHIGYCPQHPNIEKNLTLEEVLLISARCYGLAREEAHERKESLLDQFDLRAYTRGTVEELSGGYRQRFLIARALMHKPSLVILDEPTVGLDPHIRREIWEVIKGLRQQEVTVLLTTHYLDEAEKLSDRVALIHDGRIRTVDTPEKLKTHHQKNTLEEVFLKFVDDPNAEIFNSVPNDA